MQRYVVRQALVQISAQQLKLFPSQRKAFFKGGFFLFFLLIYVIQHCFIASDSTVLEDAEIEPWTVATLALTARRSNHLAKSHTQLG